MSFPIEPSRVIPTYVTSLEHPDAILLQVGIKKREIWGGEDTWRFEEQQTSPEAPPQ
jgi:hypothetical protein